MRYCLVYHRYFLQKSSINHVFYRQIYNTQTHPHTYYKHTHTHYRVHKKDKYFISIIAMHVQHSHQHAYTCTSVTSLSQATHTPNEHAMRCDAMRWGHVMSCYTLSSIEVSRSTFNIGHPKIFNASEKTVPTADSKITDIYWTRSDVNKDLK